MIILRTRRPDEQGRHRYRLAWPDSRGAYVLDIGTGKCTHASHATLAKSYRRTNDLTAAREYINSEMDRVLKP